FFLVASPHLLTLLFFLLLRPRPPSSPLFPYTTLFRSEANPPRGGLKPDYLDRCSLNTGIRIKTAPHRGAAVPENSSSTSSRASGDRKSTRLNSSHVKSSYAVFCLKKQKRQLRRQPPSV